VRTAAAAARSTGACVWPFLAKGALMYLFPGSRIDKTIFVGKGDLVRPEVIAAARREKPQIHPWLQDLEGVPPGKQFQIKSFMGASFGNDVTGLSIGIPTISVLFSQPLIELGLRIPTFVHNPYSASRVTARQAFRDVLPPQIAERTSKGIIDLSLAEQVAKHRKFLRELLLDGRMVQLGLLNRDKLDIGLSEEHRLNSEGDSEIMYGHLHTEAWLRSMEDELAEQPTLSGEWGAYITAGA
jgi:asparagine synthase (glutamine-hydrolysing)